MALIHKSWIILFMQYGAQILVKLFGLPCYECSRSLLFFPFFGEVCEVELEGFSFACFFFFYVCPVSELSYIDISF